MSRQCHVRVLHIFDAACNLINEAGEVVSLVSPQIGDGPFNIVVPNIRFTDHLSPTDPITITPNALTIGSLTINTASAHLWNPRPPWKALHENLSDSAKKYETEVTRFTPYEPSGSSAPLARGANPSVSEDGGYRAVDNPPPFRASNLSRLANHLPLLLLNTLRDQAPPGSLARLLVNLTPDLATLGPSPLQNGEGKGEPPGAVRKGVRSNYSTAILHTARDPAAKLITGLHRSDRALCLEGVTGLAGLGSGLTPSGDDWLVGCMLAIWAISDQPTIHPTAIAQPAAPLTTTLSAAWLHAAARGECGIRWHTLINALTTDSQPAITQAAKAVIHQGHTSGADALAGFIALLASHTGEGVQIPSPRSTC